MLCQLDSAEMTAVTLPDGRRLAYDLSGPDDAPLVLLSNSLMTNFSAWDRSPPSCSRKTSACCDGTCQATGGPLRRGT